MSFRDVFVGQPSNGMGISVLNTEDPEDGATLVFQDAPTGVTKQFHANADQMRVLADSITNATRPSDRLPADGSPPCEKCRFGYVDPGDGRRRCRHPTILTVNVNTGDLYAPPCAHERNNVKRVCGPKGKLWEDREDKPRKDREDKPRKDRK